jgi:hypothetical protein
MTQLCRLKPTHRNPMPKRLVNGGSNFGRDSAESRLDYSNRVWGVMTPQACRLTRIHLYHVSR